MTKNFAKGFGTYAAVVSIVTALTGWLSVRETVGTMFATYSGYDVAVFAVTAAQAGIVAIFMHKAYMKTALSGGIVLGMALSISMPAMLAATDPDVTVMEMIHAASAETYLRSTLFAVSVALCVALTVAIVGLTVRQVRTFAAGM